MPEQIENSMVVDSYCNEEEYGVPKKRRKDRYNNYEMEERGIENERSDSIS